MIRGYFGDSLAPLRIFNAILRSLFSAAAYRSGQAVRKHAGFPSPGEGRVVRRSCERLSGHGSSTEGRGERSLEPSRFWLAGAKAAYLRANLPELFKRFSHRLASAGILFKSELRRLNPQWSLRLSPKIFGYSGSNLLSRNLGCILYRLRACSLWHIIVSLKA